MSDEATTTDAPAASGPMFKPPSESGGDFWPAQEGMYRGILTGFAVGPVFDRINKDTGEKTPDPTVRWMWDLTQLDGSPVTYVPDQGDNAGKTINAKGEALSSLLTSEKSKGGKWFKVHLGRDLILGENPEGMMKEAVGAEVILIYAPNTKGKIAVMQVMPYNKE